LISKISLDQVNAIALTMPITSLCLQLEPGEKITLQPLSWQRFEVILSELGEKRSSRIAYANGILEIMAPLVLQL